MMTFALVALSWLAQQDKPKPDIAGEKYGPHARNVFDLWKATSDKPAPILVFIHGGGFRAGSKDQVQGQLVRRCLEAGLSVASINYRLTDTAPFPAPMLDAARCVQTLRSRAKELNLDPARFGASGGSAGAGISLWLAFHEDLADAKATDPVLRESTRVQAVVSLNGQSSYDPRFIREHIGGKAHEHPALMPFWGLTRSELETDKAKRVYEECSPIAHLTKDDAPVWMYYGGNDQPSDKAGEGIHSEKFGFVLRDRMKELGLECTVRVGREGRGVEEQVQFLLKHLKP